MRSKKLRGFPRARFLLLANPLSGHRPTETGLGSKLAAVSTGKTRSRRPSRPRRLGEKSTRSPRAKPNLVQHEAFHPPVLPLRRIIVDVKRRIEI